MKDKLQKAKDFFHKYERHISSASLVVGFIIDNLTLQRIDLLFENLVLLFYLTVAFLGIVVFNLYKNGVLRWGILQKFGLFLPIVVQFAFGGLFSGFIIFYSRSASIFTSWPFLIILLGILIAGELIRGFYTKPTFQFTVFYTALFSFAIFYLPIVAKTMNAWIFLLSGVVSLTVFFLLIRVIFRLAPEVSIESGQKIKLSAVLVFVLINLLYFTNILPPIPLSLKDGGIYKSVVRTTDGYILNEYEESFWDTFKQYKPIPVGESGTVYAFSAVFAPTDLRTKVIHKWQYYDEGKGSWVTANTVPFAISGGRDGGYRGYSLKRNIFIGKWRVSVETERGQIIGRLKFRVI